MKNLFIFLVILGLSLAAAAAENPVFECSGLRHLRLRTHQHTFFTKVEITPNRDGTFTANKYDFRAQDKTPVGPAQTIAANLTCSDAPNTDVVIDCRYEQSTELGAYPVHLWVTAADFNKPSATIHQDPALVFLDGWTCQRSP